MLFIWIKSNNHNIWLSQSSKEGYIHIHRFLVFQNLCLLPLLLLWVLGHPWKQKRHKKWLIWCLHKTHQLRFIYSFCNKSTRTCSALLLILSLKLLFFWSFCTNLKITESDTSHLSCMVHIIKANIKEIGIRLFAHVQCTLHHKRQLDGCLNKHKQSSFDKFTF